MRLSSIAAVLRGRRSILATVVLSAVATTSAHATSIAIAPGSSSYALSSNNLAGWSNASGGYNFVFDAAGNAISNGLIMDSPTVSGSTGTAFIALDADFQQGAVTNNTIGALSAGDIVTLTFNFAGSQQKTGSAGCGAPACTGNFDALLAVTLGGIAPTVGSTPLDAAAGSSLSANILTSLIACESTNGGTIAPGVTKAPCIKSQQWSGWETETLTFDVTSANSGVLSFLASDPHAQGQDPAFALLDNVNYSVSRPSPTPEPSSLMLLGTGLAGLSGFVRSRFKKRSEATV